MQMTRGQAVDCIVFTSQIITMPLFIASSSCKDCPVVLCFPFCFFFLYFFPNFSLLYLTKRRTYLRYNALKSRKSACESCTLGTGKFDFPVIIACHVVAIMKIIIIIIQRWPMNGRPVGYVTRGCRIRWLHLCRGVISYYFQVYSKYEWLYLLGSVL